MPAWVCVIADQADTVGGEAAAVNLQDLLLDRGGHPGIDPVTEDVIESAEILAKVEDVGGPQLDIRQSQPFDDADALVNLARRQVDADESAARQGDRHRDQIAAAGATQFQHPAAFHRGRASPNSVAMVARWSG